jgi:DNA-binding PadR family transcriptional regulator
LLGMTGMQEPTLLILTALAGGDRHGYGVIGEVERLSDGGLTLSAGTLYRALDRLVGEGLVATAGEEIVDGRLRRYYRLTDDGATALEVEAQRMRTRADAALEALDNGGRVAASGTWLPGPTTGHSGPPARGRRPATRPRPVLET